MRAGGDVAGRRGDETLIHEGHLEEVLGQRPCLQIVVVGLANASQEAHGAGPTEVEVEHGQHKAFSLQDVVNGVPAVYHVDDLLNRGAVNLLVLGGNEKCRGTHELQLAQRDDLDREEPVDVVGREKQRLGEETKAAVNLNHPVHQYSPH